MFQTSNYIYSLSLFVSVASGLRCDFLILEWSWNFSSTINCNSATYLSKVIMYITSITIMRMNEIFQDHWDLCIYLNPELHYCDAMHTHTTLSLVHNVREERTKKKEQIEIIFFLSIQKRGDLSTSCIQDYLSVTSYVLCTDHFANDESFFEKRIILFFLIRERYLDITEHQVTLTLMPYLCF